MARLRRVVCGLSGGVTSAWCLGWCLRTFPRHEVIALWHDTMEEHPDTYRFKDEIAAALDVEVVERSDGRSVTELFRDEGFLGNNQNTMCSRILKQEPGWRFIDELRAVDAVIRAFRFAMLDHADDEPIEIIKVVGYSASEPRRVEHAVGQCEARGVGVRFPVIAERVSKQSTADWCSCTMKVPPSIMYEHFEHANCLGCVKGGRAYFLAIHEHHPAVFEQRARLEEEFGHSIIRGGDRDHVTLRELVQVGLKRKVGHKEKIEIGACECGD